MGSMNPPVLVSPIDISYRTSKLVGVGNMHPAAIAVLSNADSTNNSLNSRRLCYAPAGTDITDLTLAFSGIAMQNSGVGEINQASSYTVTAASIEYPLGSTPQQIWFNGAASASVAAGRLVVKSDPLAIYIPAGGEFAVKCDIAWTGTLYLNNNFGATLSPGEWCTRGTNLTSHALDNTTLTNTMSGWGFSPVCLAKPRTEIAVLGIVGDSISVGTSDTIDPNTLAMGTIARAMRAKLPIIGCGVVGNTLSAHVSRNNGISAMLRDTVTHLVMELGVNDITAAPTLAALQANFQTTINPFLARGVKVWGWTVTPHSTSTDGFLSAANQTVASTTSETLRQSFNTWLRSNYLQLGMSGIIDAAHAIDPSDSGKWSCDAGATIYPTTASGLGFATLSGSAVGSVVYGSGLQGGTTVGFGYPASTTIPWTSYAWPGETGSGATGTATSDSSGKLSTWAVTQGGTNFQSPPMINVTGPWTLDGLNPTTRGVHEIINKTGLSPAFFTF